MGFVFWAYSSFLLAIEESKDSYYYSPNEALSSMKTYSIPLMLTGAINLFAFWGVLKILNEDHIETNTKKSQKKQNELGNEIEHMSMNEIDDLIQNALNQKRDDA